MTKIVVNTSGKVKRVSKDEARKLVRNGWSYASKVDYRQQKRRG